MEAMVSFKTGIFFDPFKVWSISRRMEGWRGDRTLYFFKVQSISRKIEG
jgi:hypothetical protein